MPAPGRQLPDFPWDLLAPFGQRAAQHPAGIVDLSVGTPVDPTPEAIQAALRGAANAPGYPTTAGTEQLRSACAGWMHRRLGAHVETSAVLPTVGSKEFIALLPTVLGLGQRSHVVIPAIAYPTYAVSAAMVGARITATDEVEDVHDADLIWINSPSNPTGAVLDAQRLRSIVAHARATGALLISDECYIELAWQGQPVSILHPSICGDTHDGILAVHSLSKRSNLAGYRFGFAAGDPELIGRLLAVRKHLGLMVPTPVQQAAVAAYADDDAVAEQVECYRARRDVLRLALEQAGFTIDHGQAGLYLWATDGQDCWTTVQWFAERGILVTPGQFYGPAGARHVRVAFTASDAAVAQFAARLASG